jgi:hypothetical protein
VGPRAGKLESAFFEEQSTAQPSDERERWRQQRKKSAKRSQPLSLYIWAAAQGMFCDQLGQRSRTQVVQPAKHCTGSSRAEGEERDGMPRDERELGGARKLVYTCYKPSERRSMPSQRIVRHPVTQLKR